MLGEAEIHSQECRSLVAENCLHSTPTLTPPPYSGSPARLEYKCFKCGDVGHWANNCRLNTSTKSSSPQQNVPVLRCHCGVSLPINISRSDANPGRKYYSRNCNCDNVKANRGRKSFFMWCDSVNAPMCQCGAGPCTINIQRGSDIKYYTCRIKTGHGSCGFLQFETLPNSRPRSMEQDKQPKLSLQRGEPSNIVTQEDECSIPSFSDRSIVVHESETCNSVMAEGHSMSRLMSRSDIHSRQIEFWNQISAAGNSPNGCNVSQNLALQVHGWVGRLAFPPPRILEVPSLRHFFCAIFPLFDPTIVSEYVDISDSGCSSIIFHASSNAVVDEVSQNALSSETQLFSEPLGTSSLERSFTDMQKGVTNPIVKSVGKTLQKDFPSLLESMELVDLQAANAAFDVLPAQMEAIVQDNCNQQVPTIKRSFEKCLDDISGIHAVPEAYSALMASDNNYRQSDNNKLASHLKDMLHQFTRFEKYVGQSKRIIQATYQDLTKPLKLQEVEEEQLMARTALDETCPSSREIKVGDRRKRQKTITDYFNEAG